MKDVAEFLKGLATVAWPILIAVGLYKCFPLIRAFLSRDKVTVKFGNMEISAEQAAQSLASQVEDLQNKVIAIEQKISSESSHLDQFDFHGEPVTVRIRRGDRYRILWVDDFPSNNAIQIKKLMDDGYWVDVASITDQALQMFEHTEYDLVISDMGRIEDGKNKPDAGIAFIQEIRRRDQKIPIVIYTTDSAAKREGRRALEFGASYVVSSTIALYRILAFEADKAKK